MKRFLAMILLCFGTFCAANAGEILAPNTHATAATTTQNQPLNQAPNAPQFLAPIAPAAQNLDAKNAQFLARNQAQILAQNQAQFLAQNSPQTPDKTPAQQLQNQLAATLASAEQICLAASFRAQICQKVGLLYELATPPQPAAAKQYLNFACELSADRGECHLYYARAYETGSPLAQNQAAAREFYAIACKKGAQAACGK